MGRNVNIVERTDMTEIDIDPPWIKEMTKMMKKMANTPKEEMGKRQPGELSTFEKKVDEAAIRANIENKARTEVLPPSEYPSTQDPK